MALVFSESGEVEFYLPEGEWTALLTGERVTGGCWLRETHGFDSLPLYVRPGAVLPWGAREDRPDYNYHEGLRLRVFPGGAGHRTITVTSPDGAAREYSANLADPTE